MNNYLTRLITQILTKNEEARDDWMLTIKEVHDRELMIWYMDKSEYYDALFSGRLSNVQTISRVWRWVQEKRPELRGKTWEERQRQAGMVASEVAEFKNLQSSLF